MENRIRQKSKGTVGSLNSPLFLYSFPDTECCTAMDYKSVWQVPVVMTEQIPSIPHRTMLETAASV